VRFKSDKGIILLAKGRLSAILVSVTLDEKEIQSQWLRASLLQSDSMKIYDS
jgi:hypothetical protein